MLVALVAERCQPPGDLATADVLVLSDVVSWPSDPLLLRSQRTCSTDPGSPHVATSLVTEQACTIEAIEQEATERHFMPQAIVSLGRSGGPLDDFNVRISNLVRQIAPANFVSTPTLFE